MKLRIGVTALLFLLSPMVTLVAQAPGYLGKKLSLTLGVSSFPAISGPTQNNRGSRAFAESSGSTGINYELEGQVSYVTGRSSSLGLGVSQYYTGAVVDAFTTLPYDPDLIPGGFVAEPGDDHELFYRLNVKSIGVTYSLYSTSKAALAPLGNRFDLGLKRSFMTGEIIDKRTSYENDELGEIFGHSNFGIDAKKHYDFFMIGWSNNQILWDRFIFRAGFRIGLPLSFKYITYLQNGTNNAPDYYENRNQVEFETRVFERLFRHELFRLDLAVGVLIF